MPRNDDDATTPDTANGTADAGQLQYVSISHETRRRYLNYAMSVIMSRALPDVRDGLKPVQRRILYTMYEEMRLLSGLKHRKCAGIVGATMQDYHPHGDLALYDALVRMAQDFTYRYPLVDGQGNFGSVMGLPAAHQRYTEARLTAISEQLLIELRYETVDLRPNYDARKQEPVVLPARFPNLLANGCSGIAVGMATNIPPHNLEELIRACLFLIDSETEVTVAQLMKYVKGPDFPLGGRIVTDRTSLRLMYEEGRGSIKVRAEWRLDKEKRQEVASRIVIYTIPYGVETNPLMAELGEIINGRNLPQVLELNDETNEKLGLRIVLELKKDADPEMVMAYLYKHSSLEQNFAYNATCLVPTESGTLTPARCNLVEMLKHFLDFRLQTVRRRFQYLLAQLERRIHLLEGFAIIFDGLDRAIKIIRNSDGKQDAATKLMKEFPLDEVQTMAILEMQLYRISKLEIDDILKELEEKRAEAERLRKLLKSEARLWGVVRTELEELLTLFPDKRKTSIGSSEEVTEFDATAYIVKENANVVLTREGWIKRVGRLAKVEGTRVREGDTVLAVVPGSTLDTVVFFASDGIAYTLPIDQVPASSGYGEPISKHVKLQDGVSIVAAITTDSRFTPEDVQTKDAPLPFPHLFVVTAFGNVLRLPLSPFRTASNKNGRKFCRVVPGDRIVSVELIREAESVFIVTRKARLIHFNIADVPILSGAGKGVRGIKIETGDSVLGFKQMTRPSDALRVTTNADKTMTFGQMKYTVTSRGGRGIRTSHRSEYVEILRDPIELVDWATLEGEAKEAK
ncbi:MAG: DNA topoisomerase (ATP-hydrolyzing) subunit A [Planctomycetaceae bacterium]